MNSDLIQYGMEVSSFHDARYFSAENVIQRELTPYNCPEPIKTLLIEELGEDWKNKFWGENYDQLFPEVKQNLNK
jgi:hypothetical protein